MFNHIISLENLLAAWKEFRRGKRNKIDVQMFERNLEDNLFSLYDDLANKTYRHGSYEKFYIFDPKFRVIHKATVRDRVVHHAIYRILSPIFDRSFIYDSYSCRLEKGTHKAVFRLEKFLRQASKNYTRNCWALKLDIAKFFNSIDHQILFDKLFKQITDDNVLWLLQEIVKSFSIGGEVLGGGLKGIPIGNLTSQLFANFYLNDFDHFIKEKIGVRFYLRYTDDFVILHHDPVALVSVLSVIRSFLEKNLSLYLHPKKIILKKARQGVDFLGYVSLPYFRILRTKTKKRMFKKLWRQNELVGDGLVSTESFNQSLQSYRGLLSHCRGCKISEQLVDFHL